MSDTTKNAVILGIDTSNYTTSAAYSVPDIGHVSGGILHAAQKELLKVKEGERGLRQSDALFLHTCNLPHIFERLFANATPRPDILAIGYSSQPRRMEGSYMPCFLAGEAVARAMAAALDVPVFAFSHQEGHIAAAAYAAMQESGKALFANAPFLAFHVSGGTTDLLHVTPKDGRYQIEMLGCALDLHAGQAIDRTGVMLGLSFPCGPKLEELASACISDIPVPKISVKGCDCNLSGLENLTKKLYESGAPKEEVAKFAFLFLEKTLCAMTEHALNAYPRLPVLFAGGVMSNHLMRSALSSVCQKHGSEAAFAPPAFSADNAIGTSLLACRAYLNQK